jgi:hypothetical protein
LVLAAKVFLVREKYELDLLAQKLKTFKVEQETTVEGQNFDLVSEVKDLAVGKAELEGTFSFDSVFVVRHRGNNVPVARTFEAPFRFDFYKDRLLLTVFEKKARANNVANEISKAVFLSLGQVVEARISPETLRAFHEDNFDDTKIIFYDDVDLPNITKLSLYGEVLGLTSLYSDYLTHGKLWYIVFKSKKFGYVIGLTRNCVVTAFSRMEMEEFRLFVKDQVFPLIAQ